jgi:hypothetical protein
MAYKKLDGATVVEVLPASGDNCHSRRTISVGDWISNRQRLPGNSLLIALDITQHALAWRKRTVRRLHHIADLLMGMVNRQCDV